jgi:hypothetical protein
VCIPSINCAHPCPFQRSSIHPSIQSHICSKRMLVFMICVRILCLPSLPTILTTLLVSEREEEAYFSLWLVCCVYAPAHSFITTFFTRFDSLPKSSNTACPLCCICATSSMAAVVVSALANMIKSADHIKSWLRVHPRASSYL